MRTLGGRPYSGWSRAAFALGLALLLGLGPAAAEEEAATDPVWASHASGLEVVGISSLRVHLKRGNPLLAHVHGLGIARSTNGGQDWEVIQKGIDPRHVPGPRDHAEIALDPNDVDILWLASKGEVYRSDDAGDTWQRKSSGGLVSWSWDRRRSGMRIRGLVVDPGKSLHVLAGTRTDGGMTGGLYETTDGGKSWEQIAGNDKPKSELGHDAWPIVLDPQTDKNIGVGGAGGFWFSDDRGREFKRADPGEIGVHDVRAVGRHGKKELCLADGRGVWLSRGGGRKWDKEPAYVGDMATVHPDPHSRRRVYAVARDKGLVVSTDQRHTKWEEYGAADLEIEELLAHPRDKDVLYLASPVTGLHRSGDNGVTIEAVKAKVEPIVPAMVAIAMHPGDVDRVLALTRHGLVFTSLDRGETWERAGRLGMHPSVLLADPSATGAWFAAGRELLRTADNGATWEPVYRPEDPEERIVDVERQDDGALYLLLERSRQVAFSADGQRWTLSKPTSRTSGAWAASFTVDPINPQHILMATRTLAPTWKPKDEEGGAFETWDEGRTWQPLVDGLTKDKAPLPRWNRGRIAAYEPTTALLFYSADGLGLFARIAYDPVVHKKPKVKPVWVDVSPPLPGSQVTSWAMVPATADAAADLVVQVEGENDTRTLFRASTMDLHERVEIAMGIKKLEEGAELPTLWSPMPSPGARLADLVVDPHLPARLLGADATGVKGILSFGVPGQRPEGSNGTDAADVVEPEEPRPPEGLRAFTGGGDGAVRVWGLADGKVLSSLKGNQDQVLAVALAPDASLVATGGEDKSVRLYGASDGSDQGLLEPETFDSTVNGLAFSPSSKQLYVAMEQSWAVVEWNLETKETRSFVGHTAGVLCVAVSADGKRVVSGGRDQTIRCWDPETATEVCTIRAGTEILTIALSPDGKRVYAGGRGASVRVYDLDAPSKEVLEGEVQKTFVSAIAASPDGALLYVAGDEGVRVVQAANLRPVAQPAAGQYLGPKTPAFCVAVSRDGQWVVAGDSDNGLWVWLREEAEAYWSTTTAHVGAVNCVTLTPDVGEDEDSEEPAETPN